MEGGVDDVDERASHDAVREENADSAGEPAGDNKFQKAIGAWRSMGLVQCRKHQPLTMARH